MAVKNNFAPIFTRLKSILEPYASHMIVVTDTDEQYYLDTRYIMKSKKPLFFGAVKVGKSYVSFHLMPVYAFPDLLQQISPALKKRMQGKSCFNFTALDEMLFKELEGLTRAGVERYRNRNTI